MTWHDIMEYAHQGIELKNIPGLPANPSTTAPAMADAAKDETPRPVALTSRGKQVLMRIERAMEDAARQPLAVGVRAPGPRASADPATTVGVAVDQAFKGQGLGGVLLADALTRVIRSEIAAYALVVDAKDNMAANFYRHHGFLETASNPLTLFLPLATVPVPTNNYRV